MQRIFGLLFCVLLTVLFSCRREDDLFEDSSARLNFSADTVSFDTVFTTVGSTTENFRVYNPYKETIRISSIRLVGGEQSTFRMNVDGRPGTYHENIEIAPEDSMWIFVEATVDPNDDQNPFVIEDFIEFTTNGNRQEISLVAWGQNAIYFTPTTFNRNLPDFTCLTGPCSENIPPVDVTWTDSLPYVVYGFVVVDSLDKLTIEAGTQIYFHNNSGMWVYSGGELKVNGTKEEPVIFRGDRLEPRYDDIPGQWDRIWINEGGMHEINYAIIKNAFIGIHAEFLPFRDPDGTAPPSSQPWKLKLTNTIIDNCSGFGLLTGLYNVEAENLVISDCGQYNVAIQSDGRYQFNHCTFANYFSESSRETPAFFVQNSVVNALRTQIISPPDVEVYNSIIDGNLESEFNTEIVESNSSEPDTLFLDFQNTIIKSDQDLSDITQFRDIIANPENGIFIDPRGGDYSLSENSVARDKGSIIFGNRVPIDLNGENRTSDGSPDLGAFEFIP